MVSDSFVTQWPTACQASLSVGFHRQEYWNGLPFPPLGDLPDPGIEPGSPACQADSIAGPEEIGSLPPQGPARSHATSLFQNSLGALTSLTSSTVHLPV